MTNRLLTSVLLTVPMMLGLSVHGFSQSSYDAYEQGRQSVRDAMERNQREYEQSDEFRQLQQRRENFERGYGAEPEQLFRQMSDRIDPVRELPPFERYLKAAGLVYQFTIDQGDFDRAAASAQMLLYYYENANSRYGQIADLAYAGGELQDNAANFIRGYANLPEGTHIELDIAEDGATVEVGFLDSDGDRQTRVLTHPLTIAANAGGFLEATFEEDARQAARIQSFPQ